MSTATASSTALQKGDLVLITGATGWIGSHIADQALQHGLNVRLVYRDEAKVNELKAAFEKRYPDATIDTAYVPSFEKDDAYDEAFKDGKVKGVVHSATLIGQGDWNTLVVPVIKTYEVLLQAAARQPSVKRFVLTSSTAAAALVNKDKNAPVQHVTADSWNDACIQRARGPEPSFVDTYAASKAASEQRAWQFVRENKPGFVLNSVLPAFSIGRAVEGTPFSSSAQLLRATVLDASDFAVNVLGPQCFIDVDDIAILHVLGLVGENVENERLLGRNAPVSWDQIIDLAHKVLPNANTPPKSEATALIERNTVDNSRVVELLKPYGGLKSAEDAFKRTLEV